LLKTACRSPSPVAISRQPVPSKWATTPPAPATQTSSALAADTAKRSLRIGLGAVACHVVRSQ
jgi:hypothetical protein